ncbi:MAG TPA: peptidoglycan-binding protein, partial [Actinomycetota bacterium]|nr:peptidoglycan-binding protein [Actinomycetota bacterium]
GERGSEASPAGSPARAGAQPVRAAGEQDDRAARRDGAEDRSGRGKNDPGRRGARRANHDRRTREERILRPGARGDRVLALQRALRDLGYWLGRPDGTYGLLTEQAVLAFQGVEGIGRDGAAGPETFGALRSAKRPSPRSTRGDLIEIDEDRGALFVVRDGTARWVFHTSTGTDEPYSHPSGETLAADTPNGRWTVSWAFDGWRESDLGEMWRPRYFHADGIAIHGFESVPAYPASHGCARVSIAAMNLIWERDLAPLGSTVWVY